MLDMSPLLTATTSRTPEIPPFASLKSSSLVSTLSNHVILLLNGLPLDKFEDISLGQVRDSPF